MHVPAPYRSPEKGLSLALTRKRLQTGPGSFQGGVQNSVQVCPACHHPATILVTARDLNRATTTTRFSYFQCGACELVFLHPMPADMRPFYAGGYAPIPVSAAELREQAAPDRYRLEPLLRYKQQGRLLEIGPWRGAFCINALDAGFDVTAIEMDAQCVHFLRDQVGIQAIESDDPAVTLAALPQPFDVIALWHSLEHMKEPWEVVAAAARALLPGGILILALPNIAGLEFRLLRAGWRHLDAPRHLCFYPPSGLERLCRQHGLRCLELYTHDHLSTLLARETWLVWAQRWFGRGGTALRIARRAERWARSAERRRPYSGSGITAVFQRPAAE